MIFPNLYKLTSTGKTQFWRIWVEGSTIWTEYGQVGGKIRVTSDVITKGKNVGRANATTPEQQAIAEAQARWTKKKDKSYVEEVDRAARAESDVVNGVNCMLAHEYKKHAHKIKWPAAVQPKLDGIRCLAVVKSGKVSLWTRGRKPIFGVPHIVAALELSLQNYSGPDLVLDGELYNHDFKRNFNQIVSYVRAQTPKKGHEVVQYHIYDVIQEGRPFLDRARWLQTFHSSQVRLAPGGEQTIKLVVTMFVDSEETLQQAYAEALDAGYEGVMVRNLSSKYQGKRTYDLLKVKPMMEEEFPIIGVRSGRGKMTGLAIFECALPNGSTFETKLTGKMKDLAKYLEDHSTWQGKKLTVTFQDYTPDGKPRFNSGKAVRDYE